MRVKSPVRMQWEMRKSHGIRAKAEHLAFSGGFSVPPVSIVPTFEMCHLLIAGLVGNRKRGL